MTKDEAAARWPRFVRLVARYLDTSEERAAWALAKMKEGRALYRGIARDAFAGRRNHARR